MEKLLTIVVPTYNIPQYIGKNIKSFQQVKDEYKDYFEVLIINDGSKDNTVEVAKNIIEKDNKLDIRIIDKENGGHGSTINRGIEEAKGKYFKVIDGDDWINVEEFEQYLNKLSAVDVDMIITDYTEQHIYNGDVVRIKGIEQIEKDIVFDNIPNKRIPMHALSYKTKILKDNSIRLSEKVFYVDMQYTLFPLEYVKSYVYWNLDIYQYFLGRPEQSMAIESMKKNIHHHLIVTKTILSFYDNVYQNDYLKEVLVSTLDYLINTQVLISLLVENKDELLRELFYEIDKSKFDYKFNRKQKRTSLEYINYKTKGIFSKFIRGITLNQVKRQLGDENSLC